MWRSRACGNHAHWRLPSCLRKQQGIRGMHCVPHRHTGRHQTLDKQSNHSYAHTMALTNAQRQKHYRDNARAAYNLMKTLEKIMAIDIAIEETLLEALSLYKKSVERQKTAKPKFAEIYDRELSDIQRCIDWVRTQKPK